MGNKSRENWNIDACLCNCANRAKKNCEWCIRFSNFKEERKEKACSIEKLKSLVKNFLSDICLLRMKFFARVSGKQNQS